MRLKDLVMLVTLAALWGGSFLFIRIAAPVLGPVIVVELRVLLATGALFVFARFAKHEMHIRHKWRQYLVLGVFNAVLPFTLISYAELHLNAGLAAILNATTPMFAVIVSWLWVKDPFTTKKLAGVVLGIVGVGVVLGLHWGASSFQALEPASLSLLAALSYAVVGVFSSRHLKGEKPMDMAFGQQLAASVVLLPFSLMMLPRTRPSLVVMLSVLALAVLSTAVAYVLYFALIHSIGPVSALTVTFLVPVFGVIWSSMFLGEVITVRLIAGLVIILASVALVAKVNIRKIWSKQSAKT